MLLVSNGNTTAVVDRLEADGLVRRTVKDSDRRTVFVALTDAGLSQFERLAADHERQIDAHFAGLSDADVDRLTDILKRAGKGAQP
jgi:DNA-binding MarR family transcriptional regulator